MPLRIVLLEEGACPVAFCETCDRPIELASNGLYMWRDPSREFTRRKLVFRKDDTAAEIWTVHKGACDRLFTRAYAGNPGELSTEELELLPGYLARNINWRVFSQLANGKADVDYDHRGVVSPKSRFNILRRDGYACQICGRGAVDGLQLHIDHKHPRSKGGDASEENLWTLCSDCNLGKGAASL